MTWIFVVKIKKDDIFGLLSIITFFSALQNIINVYNKYIFQTQIWCGECNEYLFKYKALYCLWQEFFTLRIN